jgi:hypothetical protein
MKESDIDLIKEDEMDLKCSMHSLSTDLTILPLYPNINNPVVEWLVNYWNVFEFLFEKLTIRIFAGTFPLILPEPFGIFR